MGTAIFRPPRLPVALVALILAGCGSSAAFSWLRPADVPSGWPTMRIPLGASMPYPPGWTRIPGDRGSATVALLDSRDAYLGYLNLTPRQGQETLADWPAFRIEHNADENQTSVTKLAAATEHGFRQGKVSCVKDAYRTKTGARYIELACLLEGRSSTAVVVGASPPRVWQRMAPLLERAIAGARVR